MAGERILIIEDNPEHVEFLLTDVLAPHGYLAQTTTCGQSGLQAAREERPDLVLLDLELEDKSATDMLQQLQVSGNPPVILMTPPEAAASALQYLGQGARDALVKPFRAENMALSIASVLRQDRLAEERERLVRNLAAANVQLEQRLDELQTLHDAGRALLSNLDLQQVLNALVQTAVALSQAERGYVLWCDPNNDLLTLDAAHNLGHDYAPGFCMRVDDSVAGYVVRSGEPLLWPGESVAAIEMRKRSLVQAGERVRSLVNVPLQNQERVIGVLGVDNVTQERDFTPRDVSFLSTLSDYASIAIKNARAHAQARQALDRWAQERQVLQSLSEDQDLGEAELAAQALVRAMQVTGAEQGLVGLQRAGDVTWLDDEGAIAKPAPQLEELARCVLDSGALRDAPLPGGDDSSSRVGLAAPIQYGGKTQGVLSMSVVARPGVDQDLRFVGEVAGALADRWDRIHQQARVALVPHSNDPLVQNIAVGICVLDSDLCIMSANPALERITGWRESELLGRKYDEVFAPQVNEQRLRPEQTLPGQALRAQGAMASAQCSITRQDGRRIPVECMAAWLEGAGAAPAGVVTTLRDLTPEIELGQLRRAFKTLAAHSLRAQLTAINSLAEVLRQGDLPNDVRHEIMEALQTQNVQLEQLNQEMLNTRHSQAKTMPLRYHPVTLKPIIEQVVKYFQAAAGNSSLQVVLMPDLPFVIGDENKIELALANIIDNALAPDDLQTLVISAGASEDQVVVAVERTSKASPPPVNGKHALTEKLPQTALDRELNTARKLILAQGGQVWTENQPGMSTRFCFSLPKMEVGDDAQAFID